MPETDSLMIKYEHMVLCSTLTVRRLGLRLDKEEWVLTFAQDNYLVLFIDKALADI